MRSSGDRRSLRDDVVGDRVLHGGLSRAGRCGCRKICKVEQGDAGGPGVVRDGVSQFHELVKWGAIGGRKYQDHVLQEAAEKGFRSWPRLPNSCRMRWSSWGGLLHSASDLRWTTAAFRWSYGATGCEVSRMLASSSAMLLGKEVTML